MKILLIDNDKPFIEIFKSTLDKEFIIIIRESAEEAIKYLEAESDVDLIMTECVLPDTNGIKLLNQLKKIPSASSIPAAVCSILNDERIIRLAIQTGYRTYLLKPLFPRILRERVRELLKDKKLLKDKAEIMYDDELDETSYNKVADEFAGQLNLLIDSLRDAIDQKKRIALSGNLQNILQNISIMGTEKLQSLFVESLMTREVGPPSETLLEGYGSLLKDLCKLHQLVLKSKDIKIKGEDTAALKGRRRPRRGMRGIPAQMMPQAALPQGDSAAEEEAMAEPDAAELDERLRTPLHIAAARGNINEMQLLIAGGANVNATDIEELTPLHLAVRYSQKQSVLNLLMNGAYVNARHYKTGNTPLHMAILQREYDIAKALISKRADMNIANSEGCTPLHYAPSESIAELLISNGADLNARDGGGASPLHCAVSKGRVEVMMLLIKNGANINIRDRFDQTPLKCAKMSGKKKLMDILIKHGGKE